jgi:hypothetical protein
MESVGCLADSTSIVRCGDRTFSQVTRKGFSLPDGLYDPGALSGHLRIAQPRRLEHAD